MWICNSSDTGRFTGDDHRTYDFPVLNRSDSSSSSSIGNNSDASTHSDDDDGAGDVQSSFKGSLNNLCDLEDALPAKRGISTFYSGKSKSYTSLADAVSAPSIQDIVKPEDAYNRKRKNMLAHSVLLNSNRNFSSKSGISKRVANGNRAGPLPNSNEGAESSSAPSVSRPPLPAARPRVLPSNESLKSSPRSVCSPWRSFSLSDLQHAGNKRDDEEEEEDG